MIDYLKNNILSILAIIVAILIYFLQNRRKGINYAVITNTELVSVSKLIASNIQILYNGEPVSKVYLFEIRFTNTGNLPILPEDYIEPLRIVFPKESKILSLEILSGEKHIGMDKGSSNNIVILSKSLLNPKDNFVVKILIGETDGSFNIRARIAGVRNISEHPVNKYAKQIKIGTFIGWVIVAAAILIIFPTNELKPLWIILWIIFGWILVGIISTIFETESDRQKRMSYIKKR